MVPLLKDISLQMNLDSDSEEMGKRHILNLGVETNKLTVSVSRSEWTFVKMQNLHKIVIL